MSDSSNGFTPQKLYNLSQCDDKSTTKLLLSLSIMINKKKNSRHPIDCGRIIFFFPINNFVVLLISISCT